MEDAQGSEPWLDGRSTPWVWRTLLADAVLVAGAVPWLAATAVDHLGDPDGERVDLLRGRPAVVARLSVGHLRVTGADRLAFVQGLVSHDVAGLAIGAGVDALLLDHRGQPLAGLSAVRRLDDLFLAVDDGAGETVRRSFVDHVIFDQVEVALLDDRLATASMFAHDASALGRILDAAWPGAAAALSRAVTGSEGGAVAAVPTAAGRALLRPRRLGPGWVVDVHLLAEDLLSAWPSWLGAGSRPVGERAWTALRVTHGVASALGEGRLGLPQEVGLEGRVSYRKGCYLGQEIMARVEARGRLRRGLRTLRLAGPPPGLGAAVGWRVEDADGKPIGNVGSAAPAADGDGWWALAVVRLGAASTPWQVAVDGPPPRSGPVRTAASLRDPPGAGDGPSSAGARS